LLAALEPALQRRRDVALDGLPVLAHSLHGRLRLEDDYEQEEGDAHRHHGDGKAPVAFRKLELCDAKDRLFHR